jgi:valyl-tRNA synthetase
MSSSNDKPLENPSLHKTFDPKSLERKWYEIWEKSGYFNNTRSKQKNSDPEDAFCIQLPPPNVTGTLHMGHAFQQTLMDCMIRYHRMQGKDANWIVGTDHAGIATQLVVERQLSQKGVSRKQLGRQKFLEEVWSWKRESGSSIIGQMRRLGASANWQYADSEGHEAGYFTMDDKMSKAVVEVFVRLFEEGLIYKGNRLVNWDPKLQTAVSDLEVINIETDGKIWEIKYDGVDGDFFLVVATTRPETLLGDVAIAIHPEDEKNRHLVGKKVMVPLCNRTISVIADDYVDSSFGTGCVKITPAHDFNDFAVGERHSLEPINILNVDGTVNDKAPEKYRGLDRFAARKIIIKDLENINALVSEKPHKFKVPKSDRTGEVIEPLLTDQWFVKTADMAKKSLDVVSNKEIRFHPEHWVSTYNHWLENIQDWCISRQLWWGHQIPAWYDVDGNVYVARSEVEAKNNAANRGYKGPLTRDEDVLDTWFSSALVPFTSLGWPEHNDDLDRYLPSNVLVTGFDIIFFWVARMIMMTTHFTGKVPFKDVYINALVRDAEGQKMSKSKGNTIDPIDLLDGIDLEALIDKSTKGLMLDEHQEKIKGYLRKNYPKGISAYGADAVRFTFTSLATFTRTLNFDLGRCEGYRNFCNKLWNASRFVLMNTAGHDCGLESHSTDECAVGGYLDFSPADRWISNEFDRTVSRVRKGLDEYRFDNASAALYQFVWDEFCDWYLEIAKIRIKHGSEAQQRATRRTLIRTLEKTLRLAHPIIPFITEELWQQVNPIAGFEGKSIMLASYPTVGTKKIDEAADETMNLVKALVSACRSLKADHNIGPSERLALHMSGDIEPIKPWFNEICALSKCKEVIASDDQLPELKGCPSTSVKGVSLTLKIEIDPEVERQKIIDEQSRVQAELEKETAKLSNDNFTSKAPKDVVQAVRHRVHQYQQQLETLSEQLARLTGK